MTFALFGRSTRGGTVEETRSGIWQMFDAEGNQIGSVGNPTCAGIMAHCLGLRLCPLPEPEPWPDHIDTLDTFLRWERKEREQ